MHLYRISRLALTTLLAVTALPARLTAQSAQDSDRTTAAAWRSAIVRLEPKTAEAWQNAAVADVAFIEKALRENSPIGLVDASAPIARNLDRASARARERAPRVRTKGGYYATLTAFGNGLGDPHAALYFYRNWNIGLAFPDAWWAGIRVRMLDSAAIVHYVAPVDSAQWRVGDRLVSCDGTALDELAARNVLPFAEAAAEDTPDLRRQSIPRLFVDLENPFIMRPAVCQRLRGDERADVPLAWRPRTDEDVRAFTAAPSAASPAASVPVTTIAAFTLTWPAPDVAWVRLPSFSGDSGTTAQIVQLAASLRASSKRLRAARHIILDVRGNGGGNSFNGVRIVREIWTERELRRHGAKEESIEVAWRASPDNLAHWRQWMTDRERRGSAAGEELSFGRRIVDGMSRSLARGESLYVERGEGINPSVRRDAPRKGVFPAAVSLLSDGSCASACLDFADLLLSMPGTRVVGADTGGDGLLMEIRVLPVPSGLLSIAVPQKVYVNRRRGHLERYEADVRFSGPWTDEAVVRWVRDGLR